MKRIELGAVVVLIRRKGITSVGSPFIIQNSKVITGDEEVVWNQTFGDIIRESIALSKDPFN